MATHFLGIDISKRNFDACLLSEDSQQHEVFMNNETGFEKLKKWLKTDDLQACMEATGTYWFNLAEYLYEKGFTVSVENPFRIRNYARSQLTRSKTDKLDAAIIARFCSTQELRQWEPLPPHIKELRSIMRRIDDLKKDIRREKCRLENDVESKVVKKTIKCNLRNLDAMVADLMESARSIVRKNKDLKRKSGLLTSINGIGELTAMILLSEMGDEKRFGSGRQLAVHAGLSPSLCESGSSVRRKPKLSKVGNKMLRKALYMPALSAMRSNKVIREFAARLESASKPNMVIIGAVMRKLLVLAYGVLKNNRPFASDFTLSPA